ncbi:MAG: hypothetical protein C5B50_04670 [Verrucomicrobia bacterium]|nr:MAG: hypothetical protein C5B50_04670 [Verrucomicrobiota bacterium]
MNTNFSPNDVAAVSGILGGVLGCFWGYRILKVVLAITGFIAGATAGWTAGLNFAPSGTITPSVCALVGGVIGAVLCIWLFYLGLFLLGAGFGTLIASSFFSAGGGQMQVMIILACAVVCGLIVLAIQKFMIIVATGFTGAWLVVAGVLHFLAGTSAPFPFVVGGMPPVPRGLPEFVPLIAWLLLGVVGMSVQFGHSRRRVAAPPPPPIKG